MRDPLLETSGKIIGFYEREFYCFSNFSSFAVVWQGRRWQTSEHAYQAAHFFDSAPELIEEIFSANSAHEAKKIVERNKDKVPAEFYNKNIALMEDICLHKLQQNPYVKKKLLQTEDKMIVEDSPVDDFWGWGPNRDGRNELGKIWMRLRDNIK
jgi:hypothetical protein